MRFLSTLFAVFLTFTCSLAHSQEAPALTAEEQQYVEWARGVWDSLDRQTGEIKLGNDVATLDVPDSFYFLNAKDSETVLVEIWGNPPGGEVLGMLFPAGTTPFDSDSWGVTIEYEEDGYVSDEDADDIDYDELLESMQDETSEASKERIRLGYESIELVGWASVPYYDPVTHKMHWAKEIKFGSQPVNTLNYNIRVLGRKGVLILNFIADMDQKPLIDSKLEEVVSLANFDAGFQYDDFDPSIDEVAAYGLGALVAGKVAAKLGFFAAILLFLKKFWIVIALAIGGLFKMLKGKKAE